MAASKRHYVLSLTDFTKIKNRVLQQIGRELIKNHLICQKGFIERVPMLVLGFLGRLHLKKESFNGLGEVLKRKLIWLSIRFNWSQLYVTR